MGLTFEWNEDKAKQNVKKHGVSFEDAAIVFSDPFSRTIADPLHSKEEDRFVILGSSHRPGLLVIVFTERGNNIRIISARRASPRERNDYEEDIE